ncbi:hypothetical protein [Bacillus atrophaeus]|uniref:hypothetical protein n=1 Tax=Bacillus atrophaeus TaxID=1452 RepID=UPI002E1D5086|nr:hypothetical protein [Bacillus atrophaeus]
MSYKAVATIRHRVRCCFEHPESERDRYLQKTGQHENSYRWLEERQIITGTTLEEISNKIDSIPCRDDSEAVIITASVLRHGDYNGNGHVIAMRRYHEPGYEEQKAAHV